MIAKCVVSPGYLSTHLPTYFPPSTSLTPSLPPLPYFNNPFFPHSLPLFPLHSYHPPVLSPSLPPSLHFLLFTYFPTSSPYLTTFPCLSLHLPTLLPTQLPTFLLPSLPPSYPAPHLSTYRNQSTRSRAPLSIGHVSGKPCCS